MSSETPKPKPLPLLFLLVAVLSFAAGGAIGMYFSSQGEEQDSPSLSETQDTEIYPAEELSEDTEINSELQENVLPEEENQENTEESEKLKRYKEMLKKSMNSPSEESVENFGIVIKSFSRNNQANDKAIDLKKTYNWDVAVYPIDSSYKVIVGPFADKKSAKTFLDSMPKLSEFIGSKIIELPKADSL